MKSFLAVLMLEPNELLSTHCQLELKVLNPKGLGSSSQRLQYPLSAPTVAEDCSVL
jgi:hypothetical protein